MAEQKNGNGQKNNEQKKFKFLFVSFEGLIGDLAWQVGKEGHDVKYYIKQEDQRDVCDGFVQKTDDWEKQADWADVIVFDDVGFGETADKLRKQGKFVVGGSTYTDKLEEDRDFGQEELRAADVTILPKWPFTDFDAAIDFIRKNPGRYVMKPSGKAQDDKELLFVGREENGEDLINLLEHYKRTWAKKIKVFQLQKFAAGVEVAVGAFFNGDYFVRPVNINFEHKKLFPGEVGPSTGEMGCYDDETEVLTKNGWKFFNGVAYDDEFATLNPETNRLEYHRPSAIVHYSHHRKLVSIKNRATDLLVTPDHNMFGQEANAYRKKQCWGLVKAKDLPGQFVVPRSAEWLGEERGTFSLPAQPFLHYGGRSVREKMLPQVLIPMDDWLAFLGLWIAEGWTTQQNYAVGIAQASKRKLPVIERALAALPFKFKRIKNGWVCYNKQLWAYLRPLGDALNKFVPTEYKELCPRQLGMLFGHMCHGDGNLQRNGFRIYYTSSKRLADDVQEILLKLGRVGIVKRRLRCGGKIGARCFKKVNPCYEVIERVEKTVAWLDKRDTETVPYSGEVHCVTVPYHTLYVRRNGKPAWCGNTSMYWCDTNKIFEATLAKMRNKLAESGYVGYIDINCIANINGIYPLEFTSRFGYPTISIQMEGVLSNWGEFLYALAKKEKFDFRVKRGFQIGVVLAVPPFPFRDPAAFRRYSEDATLIFKRPNYDGVHLCDVKLVEGDWRLAGNSGYALIVTGSGSTMDEARQLAYRRIKNISIPNMFYRTDIGVRWHSDSDRLQTWGYLY